MTLITDEFTDKVQEIANGGAVEDVAEGIVTVRLDAADHSDLGLRRQHTGWTIADVWFDERKLLFRRRIGDIDLEHFGTHGDIRARPDVDGTATLDCRSCGTTFRRSEIMTPTFGGLACPACGSDDFE